MKIDDVKYNCIHFKGDIPCVPNKKRGKVCINCDEYTETGKKILLIKLGAIGDVIRTTPLLNRLRRTYQNSHITWLTYFPDILPASQINSIKKFDFNSFISASNDHFDIAINLDKDKEACILLAEVSAKEKFGYSWSEDGHITGLSAAAQKKILTGLFDEMSKANTQSYQEEIFEICGFKFDKEPSILEVDSSFEMKWKSTFGKNRKNKIIGLNTGCGKRWPTRLWPEENWISLIGKLIEDGYIPVLLGGEDEHETNSKYSKRTGALYPGFFSLKEFIAIINECDVIVSAVSMAMHIASGLGKPLVLFNNIFNKFEFELYGKGTIIEPATGCDCYYGNVCVRESHCMNDIPVDIVLSGIKNTASINI